MSHQTTGMHLRKKSPILTLGSTLLRSVLVFAGPSHGTTDKKRRFWCVMLEFIFRRITDHFCTVEVAEGLSLSFVDVVAFDWCRYHLGGVGAVQAEFERLPQPRSWVQLAFACTALWGFERWGDHAGYERSKNRMTVTTICDNLKWKPAIAQKGVRSTPLHTGQHYFKFELVQKGSGGVAPSGGKEYHAWMFGFCRPCVDINRPAYVQSSCAWLVYQYKGHWSLKGSHASSTLNIMDDKSDVAVGENIGLLLSLGSEGSGGGTIKLMRHDKMCGTLFTGVTGPLLPCVSMRYEGAAARIHGSLHYR